MSRRTAETRLEPSEARPAKRGPAEAAPAGGKLQPSRRLFAWLGRGRGAGGVQRSVERQALRLQALRGNRYLTQTLQSSRTPDAGPAVEARREAPAIGREVEPASIQREEADTTVTINLGTVRHGTYNVTGADFTAAGNQMNARGEWGLGGARNIRGTPGPANEDGILQSVTVTAELFTSLPNWTRLAGKPEPVRNEWNRMLAALRGHENHHVSIARTHLESLETTLSGVHEDDFQRVWGEEIAALRAAQQEYDDSTHSGQDEGVTLDLAVEDE